MGNALGNLFGCHRYQVVMLGLDNSGKSTIVYRLKFEHYVQRSPTIGFNCEKFRVTSRLGKGKSFIVWDIGGQETIRPLWKTYLRQADVFDEARVEMANLMRFANLRDNVPVVLLANKQDLPEAKTGDAIRQLLAPDVGKRYLKVISCCAITGEGLDDFFPELSHIITEARSV
uniref:ADP-ribosylation factor-like protein 4C n=1 Tax=Syphacia muris TaxID=451379 RepID=A0A0N5AW53_9BILA